MFLKITSIFSGRKSCVRKMAIETPKNPPSSKASTELYRVPQISGKHAELRLVDVPGASR